MEEVIRASESLFREISRIGRFGSKYGVYPYRKVADITEQMKELASSLPDSENPEDREQLIRSELKRRLNGEASHLENLLSPRHTDFDTVISLWGIPREDIRSLRPWLLNNRDETLESIERLYQTRGIQTYELGLSGDIPSVRRQAEEFAAVHIQRYHKILGKLLQDLTRVGEFLRDIDAVPTTQGRSYFNSLTNTLAISIPAICFTTEEGNLQIRERELIALYGHEGMGHALNQVVTHASKLPYFLTHDTYLTAATMESLAQFYQQRIFEDLKNSPQAQKNLGIEHKFDEVYQEARDIAKLNEYKLRLFQYGIAVLADKTFGDPQDPNTLKKKSEILTEVTIHPRGGIEFVEQHRYDFDSQGNLSYNLVGELRYCAQPVQRALKEFSKQGITYEGNGRSVIDRTFLTGFWTPKGFIDNARINARDTSV